MNLLFIGTRIEALKTTSVFFSEYFHSCPDVLAFKNTKIDEYVKRKESNFINKIEIIDRNKQYAISTLQSILLSKKYSIIISAGFPYIIPKEILKKHNNSLFLNSHPHILPKWKGYNAIKDSVANNEIFFGATFHYMIPAFDSGDIICQIKNDLSRFSLEQKYDFIFSIIEPIVIYKGLEKVTKNYRKILL